MNFWILVFSSSHYSPFIQISRRHELRSSKSNIFRLWTSKSWYSGTRRWDGVGFSDFTKIWYRKMSQKIFFFNFRRGYLGRQTELEGVPDIYIRLRDPKFALSTFRTTKTMWSVRKHQMSKKFMFCPWTWEIQNQFSGTALKVIE